MDVWRDVVLCLAISGIFVFGFYIMAKLDKFLDENRKTIEKENENCEPSCVMLTNTFSDEEIIAEIHRFRSRHEKISILIYDGSSAELSKDFDVLIRQK